MRICLLLVFSFGISFNSFAETLILDPRKSSVNFDLSSQLFSTSGSFVDYDGELLVNQQRLPQKLSINGDVSKFSVPALPLQGKLLVSNLLNLLSSHQVKFESDSITKQGGGYLAEGFALASGKREHVSFPFRASKESEENMVLSGNYSRSGLVKSSKITSLPLGTVSCDADFKLVFDSK